jgi:hypothetical protein
VTDIARILGGSQSEAAYPLVVNDGVFAGTHAALLALDGRIRSWPRAAAWVDERPDIRWRNQFILNLALAALNCGVEMDPTYNIHLQSQEVVLRWEGDRMQAVWQGRSARILHFCGWARNKYPEWRGHFARAADERT